MVYPLATIIHVPPTCKLDSPPPKTPKVSSNHGIRLDVHFLMSHVRTKMCFFGCSSSVTVSLDPKTWELKKQVICSNTPSILWWDWERITTKETPVQRGEDGKEDERYIAVTAPWQFWNPNRYMLSGSLTPGAGNFFLLGCSSAP